MNHKDRNHKDHKDHKECGSIFLCVLRDLCGSNLRGALRGLVVIAIGFTLSVWVFAAASDSPVADAAKQGDRETVRSLLKQGVDVNAAQGDGTTALHWAARQGNVELAQMLLYAGANVKPTTRLGAYTPLLMAAATRNAA